MLIHHKGTKNTKKKKIGKRNTKARKEENTKRAFEFHTFVFSCSSFYDFSLCSLCLCGFILSSMSFDPLAPPPMLTGDIPGIGGQIKELPEDFEVEEIPAYEPSGQGDYLYLWIEKRAMGAEYFLRQIARRLELSPSEVSAAGLKDRQAVTRQMISVPVRAADRLKDLPGDGIQLLKVSRHGNKLKPGHLRGNRFRILIREPDAAAGTRLPALVEELQRKGLPNYYGPQRFGREGETVNLGLDLLHGAKRIERKAEGETKESERRMVRRSPFLRRLALSAVQSALFNHYLAQRLSDGLLHQVLEGDVMAKWPMGGLFVAKDVAREQARFEARETVPAGPIFGRKMFAADSEAAAREAATLTEADLALADFFGFGKLLQGTRRKNLVYVDDLSAEKEAEGIRLSFTLPAGSYATVLLREITKNQKMGDDDGRETM
jgi:tRNA pseudouridine13 synthase